MGDYKLETKEAYERYAQIFDPKYKEHFDLYVRPEAENFIRHLSGKSVVDLGSGPGHHAQFFKDQGLDVLCVDIAEEMLRLCQKKGLKTRLSDFEYLDLPRKSVNGVWAYTSLLHLEKSKVPAVKEKVVSLLKPKGLFGISLKEGEGEGFEEEKEKYPGVRRWFAYYQDKEVQDLMKKEFDVIYRDRRESNGFRYLAYLFRLK